MSLLWAIILGLAQGLTEFLPVSSSAHLTILGALAGVREEDALAFFLILHLGTLAALLAFFARDLWDLGVRSIRGDREAWRYNGLIVLTTLPTAVIGLALKPAVEKAMASPLAAALLLLVTAAFLAATRWFPEGGVASGAIRPRHAFLVGVAQGMAVFPGISRSGATITACLALGLTREEAFRYSFLVSLPAIGGAALLDAKAMAGMSAMVAPGTLVAGAVTSAVLGFAALALLKRTVVGRAFHWYAVWCLLASAGGLWVALGR